MKKFITAVAVLFIILVGVFTCSMTNVMAGETQEPALQKYYTCIEIEKGDTLWSIASYYTEGTSMSVEDYIEELRQMNGLTGDTIHQGRYLTVMYFAH